MKIIKISMQMWRKESNGTKKKFKKFKTKLNYASNENLIPYNNHHHGEGKKFLHFLITV